MRTPPSSLSGLVAQPQVRQAPRNLPIHLLPPSFALTDAAGVPRQPTLGEQVRDAFVSLDFLADRRRLLSAVFELYHMLTLLAALWFLASALTWTRAAGVAVLLIIFANLWNTVWYHRYCSHRTFTFRWRWVPRLLLWLNPMGFREEIYALLHYPHHLYTDQSRDPYGPHLGRLGSYVASGRFRIATDIDVADYERLKRLLAHVPLRFASHLTFQRWGCVEAPWHYLTRFMVANLAWSALAGAVGGLGTLLVLYTTVFLFTFLMRDFNYRGHGGGATRHRGWDYDRRHLGINQWFYGLIASEWHNNHHLLPRSARNGFLPGQIDLAFAFLALLRGLHIVVQLNDQRELFYKKIRARGDS